MTEISKLLAAINNDPAYMTEMDWREETDWFDKECMKAIIMGIENDEVCTLAGEMIIENWYIACDEAADVRLMDRDWDGDYVWRFQSAQDNKLAKDSIDTFVSTSKIIRADKAKREKRLKELKQNVRQHCYSKPEASYEDAINDLDRDISMLQLEDENRCLKQKLSSSEETLISLERDYKNLQEKYSKMEADWKEKTRLLTEEIEETNKENREYAIRELVEQIIVYAESKPIGVAEVIKTLLLAKHFNHHIPDECLSDELRKRLDNLGKEKQTSIIISSNKTDISNSHISNFYERT